MSNNKIYGVYMGYDHNMTDVGWYWFMARAEIETLRVLLKAKKDDEWCAYVIGCGVEDLPFMKRRLRKLYPNERY